MRHRTGLAAVTGLLVLGSLVASAPPAAATFHEMSIREVYLGSTANPGSEYVELQMWAAGQNLVDGHSIAFYNASGALVGSATFTANVLGGANQSTIVAATPAAEAEFGIAADLGLTPGYLDPTGGAVCWESLDCVSWGAFSGSVNSPTGSPADPSGIPNGMALRRTIAPGCSTLLELSDDTDNSAVDFADAFPAPRPNAVPPSERICSAKQGPPGGGGGPGLNPPQTTLRHKPAKKTHDRTPTFRFASNEAGSSYECKLDRKPFAVCRSPFTTAKLSYGRHTFRVRARDKTGLPDPSPASYKFRVVKR